STVLVVPKVPSRRDPRARVPNKTLRPITIARPRVPTPTPSIPAPCLPRHRLRPRRHHRRRCRWR
ncbi:hypothetical protein H4S01_004038, partial [Coemansia sp. RSA 2610]